MSSASSDLEETAVPALKVMRLQSPDLNQPAAGTLEARSLFSSSMILPDSFGVIHVGETFTAYLGAVNASKEHFVRRLTVNAQLQTPSHRWPMPSPLDSALGVDISPGEGVDTIVSRALEEAGQHILRVEVGYLTTEGTNKTIRKFYRFNVSNPLTIRELTVRAGDDNCFVSIAVENVSQHAMTIASATFETPAGLASQRVGGMTPLKTPERRTATQLFDNCGRLEPKASFRYLFQVKTTSRDSSMKGIACGDELGKAVLEWKKTMGETGRMASSPVKCPMTQPPGLREKNPTKLMMGTGNRFAVHGSGLSVDVAEVAANRAAGKVSSDLDQLLPVTVEPVDPPKTMKLSEPEAVQFLVVNHSEQAMKLQFQFRLNQMSGVAVLGLSYRNLGEIPPNGGSVVVVTKLIPLVAGLLRVQGCCIVEQGTGREIPQPPMFHVYVDSTLMEQ